MSWRGCALVVAGLFVLCGCEDDDPLVPETGSLEITVTTDGNGTDPDGYIVDLNSGEETEAVPVDGSVSLDGLEAGDHTVELTNVSTNCTVDGGNPRTVTVESGATETVAFAVSCIVSG